MTDSKLLADPLARFALQNLGFLLLAAIISQTAEAAAVNSPINLTRISSGLSSPVYVTAAPGESDRLFVVEKDSGSIQILKKQTDGSWRRNSQAFLQLPRDKNLIAGGERGFLGLSFHPDYQNNGKFYVSYTADDDRNTAQFKSHVDEFTVSSNNPDIADASNSKSIISFNRNRSNHNAGWIGFGKDNYLYIPTGDSGGGNDPDNVAQNLNDLRGKVLRIDVNGDDFGNDDSLNYAIPDDNPFLNNANANDAIWAYGLRNPWRASFDRETGDFYIADVGQNAFEEINLQLASSTGGENYGWVFKEGLRINRTLPDGFTSTDPIHQYSRGDGVSITGGYVYRTDNDASELQGNYLFADFISNRVWSLYFDEAGDKQVQEITDLLLPNEGTLANIASFGEDADGNIYIVTIGGDIFTIDSIAITAVPLPAAFYFLLSGVLGLFGFRKKPLPS